MNRDHRLPLQRRKPVSEIISGAMLESVVTRAKRSAVRREIEKGQRGLLWREDVYEALHSECEEDERSMSVKSACRGRNGHRGIQRRGALRRGPAGRR